MSYVRWTGKARGDTKKDKPRRGVAVGTPADVAAELGAAGWRDLVLTVDGKVVEP